MENQNNTTLRQAMNRVRITGYLKEMDLKYATDQNNRPVIRGSLKLHVPPAADHDVNVYVPQFTREGKENGAFAGVQTVMNEYISMASLLDKGYDLATAMAQCTKVAVTNGTLGRNEYNGQNGFVSRVSISSNFFSRVDTDFNPGATFEVECYIDKITDETVDGENTGRKIVDVFVPMYRGAILPQRFVVGTGLAADFENTYEVGQTAMLNGDLINTVHVTTSNQAGIGRKMEARTYINELEIMGGWNPYSEEDAKSYSRETIMAALTVRNNETIPAIMAKERKSVGAPMTPVNAPAMPMNNAVADKINNFSY